MITGTIQNRNAFVDLEVAGRASPPQQVRAIVDTGFNGYLTLPPHCVFALQLDFAGHRRGTLADGSVVLLSMYLANVTWHGRPKDVLISQAPSAPLLGMSRLRGSRMTMEVVDGGNLTISELTQQTSRLVPRGVYHGITPRFATSSALSAPR